MAEKKLTANSANEAAEFIAVIINPFSYTIIGRLILPILCIFTYRNKKIVV